MKVMIESHSGSRWTFNTLEAAKASGSLKDSTRLSDANKIITKDGVKIAVFK